MIWRQELVYHIGTVPREEAVVAELKSDKAEAVAKCIDCLVEACAWGRENRDKKELSPLVAEQKYLAPLAACLDAVDTELESPKSVGPRVSWDGLILVRGWLIILVRAHRQLLGGGGLDIEASLGRLATIDYPAPLEIGFMVKKYQDWEDLFAGRC